MNLSAIYIRYAIGSVRIAEGFTKQNHHENVGRRRRRQQFQEAKARAGLVDFKAMGDRDASYAATIVVQRHAVERDRDRAVQVSISAIPSDSSLSESPDEGGRKLCLP